MSLLLIGGFNAIWLLVVLLALAGATLEGERWWTRARRQRGTTPGAIAYMLDSVAIVSLLASVGMIVTLLFQGLAALLGNLFGWASGNPALLVGLLIVGVAVIAGVVFVRRRAGIAQSAVTPLAGVSASAQSPAAMISAPPPAPLAAKHNLADHTDKTPALASRPVEQRPQYAVAAADALADEHVPAFAMLQQRRQYVAAPQPASFLDLVEAQSHTADSSSAQRRRSFAPALAALGVLGVLALGALLFRQEVSGFFSNMRAAPAAAATSVASAPTSASGVTAQSASANVAAAIASPAPANPSGETGRVKSDLLNVRVSPGTDQAILVVLTKGDAVTLLNETRQIQGEDWVKVRVGAREGWVNQKLLE